MLNITICRQQAESEVKRERERESEGERERERGGGGGGGGERKRERVVIYTTIAQASRERERKEVAKSEQSWWSWATGWATGSEAPTTDFKPPTGKTMLVDDLYQNIVVLTTYTNFDMDLCGYFCLLSYCTTQRRRLLRRERSCTKPLATARRQN